MKIVINENNTARRQISRYLLVNYNLILNILNHVITFPDPNHEVTRGFKERAWCKPGSW